MGQKLAFTMDDAIKGVAHHGKVEVNILINEDTCGAKSFSLLVNKIKPADTCQQEGTKGHSHEIEHGVYCLSGVGSITIGEDTYPLLPGTAVFVPSQKLHYLTNLDPKEDLVYIIMYVPRERKSFFWPRVDAHLALRRGGGRVTRTAALSRYTKRPSWKLPGRPLFVIRLRPWSAPDGGRRKA